jgi:hypothetical protein
MEARNLSRRTAGKALLAAAVVLGIPGTASARSAVAGPARLTLPPPTGPFPVGTVALHLADAARADPVTGPGHPRELMVSLWYPTRDVRHHPRAPWLPAGVTRTLLADAGFPPDAAAAPLTAGHLGAPVLRVGGRLPVVVYSHGADGHRANNTIAVQELASHGYLVITVDHVYDAYTEFPGGRISVPVNDPAVIPSTPELREADIRFVLDRIEDLDAGRNPDVDRRPLPAGLRGAFDLDRTGMFGWSAGGATTARVMYLDRRVKAGLGLDAPMHGPVVTAGLDRPFMLMTAEITRANDPAVAEFWSHLTGWRRTLQADGAVHTSYGDYQFLYPQLAAAVGMSDEQLRTLIGTLDPDRAVRIQQAYPLAFFDLHLRHRGHLLDAPSPAFPELHVIP